MVASTRTVLDTFRRRPELLVGPAWAIWVAVELLPLDSGQPFILRFVALATYREPAGNVFPVTYACAIALFLLFLLVAKQLDWPRRVLVASAIPFAFTHLYEVPYDLIGYLAWPEYYYWAIWPTALLVNASWLGLGLSSAAFWRLGKMSTIALLAFVGSFIVWWIFFLPQVPPITLPSNPEGSGYILSKVVMAILIGSLIWEGRSLQHVPEPDSAEGGSSPARDESRRAVVAEMTIGPQALRTGRTI